MNDHIQKAHSQMRFLENLDNPLVQAMLAFLADYGEQASMVVSWWIEVTTDDAKRFQVRMQSGKQYRGVLRPDRANGLWAYAGDRVSEQKEDENDGS